MNERADMTARQREAAEHARHNDNATDDDNHDLLLDGLRARALGAVGQPSKSSP